MSRSGEYLVVVYRVHFWLMKSNKYYCFNNSVVIITWRLFIHNADLITASYY